MADTTHECFEKANAVLKPKNTQLSFAMQIPGGDMRLVIATQRTRGRQKPVIICASYCPFCGVHLP